VNKFLLRILMLGMVLPAPVAVFSADDEDEAVIEEIIVSATRRDVAVMDIPQSIQAITEETLEMPIYNDVRDIYNLVPGAVVHSNKQPAQEGIQFRGSGITQSNAADGLPPVGYYIDDIPYVDISTPVPPPISTFDLQRIEVIRGPQGTSYGQDSTAGSVILRTNPVDLEKFGYNARYGYASVKGSDGAGHTAGGVLNIPIAEDVFGIRLAYLREEDAGYGKIPGKRANPLEFSRDSMRIKARWKPSDKADITLTHSRWFTDYQVLPGSQIADTTGGEMIISPLITDMALAKYPSGIPTNEYEIEWSTLLAKFDLGFAELTSSTGYVDTPKKETNSEFLDYGFPMAVLFNQTAETLTQEFRLVSTNDSELQWIVGAFFVDAESEAGGFLQLDLSGWGLPITDQYIGDPIEMETMAIYAEIDYAFNEEWSMQFGLRAQDQERDSSSISIYRIPGDPLFGPYSYPEPVGTESSDFENASFRLGVTWRPNENSMYYLTQSSAARAPILVSAADEAVLAGLGLSNLAGGDESKLNNTEVGAKWTLLDGTMQLEVVYAHARWSEVPLRSQIANSAPPTTLSIGGTDATIGALEINAVWAPTDNVSFTYAGSHVDAEVKSIPGPGEVDNWPAAIYVGGDLFNYSPMTHSVSMDFSQDLANGWEGFGSIAYVHRDRPDGFDAVFDSTAYIPAREAYQNLGVTFGATKEALTLSLGIDNATNYDGMYMPRSSNMINGFIMAPRTVHFQIRYDGM